MLACSDTPTAACLIAVGFLGANTEVGPERIYSIMMLPPKKTSKNWEERQRQRRKMLSIKTREREMKQAKEDEINRKREVRREREQKAAEKERLEVMAAKVSIWHDFL